MADIINLQERLGRRSTAPAYRIYRVDRKGSIIGSGRIIEAATDAQARTRALALLDAHVIELWDRQRFIALFWPHDHPVATSLRLVDDPPAERP